MQTDTYLANTCELKLITTELIAENHPAEAIQRANLVFSKGAYLLQLETNTKVWTLAEETCLKPLRWRQPTEALVYLQQHIKNCSAIQVVHPPLFKEL